MANQNKEHNLELESQVSFPVLLPASGNDSKLLVGFNAFQSNLFWLRLVAAIFAIILFTVMLTIPNFDHAHWDPGADFLTGCIEQLSGSFKLRQYHFVIAVGVFIFIHTLLTSLYYLLPVDERNEKYVPGLRNAFMAFVGNDEIAEEVLVSAHSCLLAVTRYLECFVDFALVVMALVAFTIAAVCLDQPTQFSHQNNNQIVYFTLATFWNTYSHMNPPCVNGDDDPTPSIRASLSMLFFAFLAMVLCLQVSYRAARAEWARHGANSDDEYKYVSKGRGGRGSRSSRSEGSYHEREESHFLAQPVPSSDSEHSSASSGRGGGGGAVGTRTRQQRHHAKNDNDIGDEEIGEGEEGEEEEEEEEAISFRLPSAGVAV